MATRSTIWLKDENSYKGVYCHWDGYLSNNGKLLLENYNTLEKVKELISFGFISSLDTTIDKCVFYNRDREEDFDDYEVSSLEEMGEFLEEYNYIFQDNKWYVLDNSEELAEELIELTQEYISEND